VPRLLDKLNGKLYTAAPTPAPRGLQVAVDGPFRQRQIHTEEALPTCRRTTAGLELGRNLERRRVAAGALAWNGDKSRAAPCGVPWSSSTGPTNCRLVRRRVNRELTMKTVHQRVDASLGELAGSASPIIVSPRERGRTQVLRPSQPHREERSA
jgi:hypothetical protein